METLACDEDAEVACHVLCYRQGLIYVSDDEAVVVHPVEDGLEGCVVCDEGVGEAYGLAVARMFCDCGHDGCGVAAEEACGC